MDKMMAEKDSLAPHTSECNFKPKTCKLMCYIIPIMRKDSLFRAEQICMRARTSCCYVLLADILYNESIDMAKDLVRILFYTRLVLLLLTPLCRGCVVPWSCLRCVGHIDCIFKGHL